MNFSHYSDQTVELAVDLVNTDELTGDEIATLADLETFLTQYESLLPPDQQPATEKDLKKLHRLRDDLRAIFTAPDTETAVAQLNRILEKNNATPRVSMHDGEPHLHYEPVNAPMASRVAAIAAMGLAGVIVENGISRFGSCSASNCRDVFVDATRNRSRVHCCHSCSTREAVAAYRKRQNAG
ncbi:MAG TPA: ABATE domain-containing protein [Acidimicrobiia bacterium]|nr:ABATE domain-containing protein [Acidimicrobiia bacterium]